ncbi:MAG: glycosyltransferase [Candidatus Anammoxibacter sp.]
MDTLKISIIIELDNARVVGLENLRGTLVRIYKEVELLTVKKDGDLELHNIAFLKIQRFFEIIIVYNNNVFDESQVKKFNEEALGLNPIDLNVKLVSAPGKFYYQLKNVGAKHANGNVFIFLDSDVTPESGWLRNIIAPFFDSKVQVVGGNSYISIHNLWAKTFAMTWFFPLRSTEVRFYKRQQFFANNVAFRKEIFDKYPFPAIDGTDRGSCVRLAQILDNHGINIYRTTTAQVSHPAPKAGYNFLLRAIAQGRDDFLRIKKFEKPIYSSVISCFLRSGAKLASALISIILKHKKVKASPFVLPIVSFITVTYYFFYFIGEILSNINPRFMKKHFRL